MKLKEYRQTFNDALLDSYPQNEIDSFFFILLETYMDLKRIDLSLDPEMEIDRISVSLMNNAVERLQQQEPVQYIVGKTEFYGLHLEINDSVLIPRPETEELVDWIVQDLKSAPKEKNIEVLEIGTGSGCIPIALAKNCINTNIQAIEISKNAMLVAMENAELNEVNIKFIQSNILRANALPALFDIIVSNPPYVRHMEKKEIKRNVLDYEPHQALFVEDKDPLIFYDKISSLANSHLTQSGALYLEINQYLGKDTVALLERNGFSQIELRKDLFGNDRMIKAQR